MYIPPRHVANYNFIDNCEYYYVSINDLLKFFDCKKSELVENVNNYYNANKELIDKEYVGKFTILKKHKCTNKEKIRDINITLSILLRTYDGLYVPNKTINITSERFLVSYYIDKKDFNNGK